MQLTVVLEGEDVAVDSGGGGENMNRCQRVKLVQLTMVEEERM